jgi:hypothetical protein
VNHDDIIRLAREAGAATGRHSPHQKKESIMPLCMDVERFAALVAAAEREACAKLCEENLRDEYLRQARPIQEEVMLLAAIADCAAAIRARGESE